MTLYVTHQDCVLGLLSADAPWPVSYQKLDQVLGPRAYGEPEERLRYVISRARRQLGANESIKNVRNFGYQLVRKDPRAA